MIGVGTGEEIYLLRGGLSSRFFKKKKCASVTSLHNLKPFLSARKDFVKACSSHHFSSTSEVIHIPILLNFSVLEKREIGRNFYKLITL